MENIYGSNIINQIEYTPHTDILKIYGKNNKEIIKIENNGDFYINGKYIENDKDISRYLKKISINNYKEDLKEEIKNNPSLYDEILFELRREKIEKLKNK